MMESFAALFEESLQGKGLDVEKGAVIQGTVLASIATGSPLTLASNQKA